MSDVLAFQPRKSDPPQFVAEDEAELVSKLGELVGADQCDYCGNSCYRIERVGHGSPKPINGFTARCVTDPHQDEAEGQFEGCNRGHPIFWSDEDLVAF